MQTGNNEKQKLTMFHCLHLPSVNLQTTQTWRVCFTAHDFIVTAHDFIETVQSLIIVVIILMILLNCLKVITSKALVMVGWVAQW